MMLVCEDSVLEVTGVGAGLDDVLVTDVVLVETEVVFAKGFGKAGATSVEFIVHESRLATAPIDREESEALFFPIFFTVIENVFGVIFTPVTTTFSGFSCTHD